MIVFGLIIMTTEELIEPAQVRQGHLDSRRGGRSGGLRRRGVRQRLDRAEGSGPLGDGLGVDNMFARAFFDGLADPRQRVLGQELQDAHEPPRARRGAVELLQRRAELGEARRQRPVAKRRRSRGRPACDPGSPGNGSDL